MRVRLVLLALAFFLWLSVLSCIWIWSDAVAGFVVPFAHISKWSGCRFALTGRLRLIRLTHYHINLFILSVVDAFLMQCSYPFDNVASLENKSSVTLQDTFDLGLGNADACWT